MIKIACATDDGTNLIKRHFGDARSYAIYEIDNHEYNFVKTIENITVDEDEHEEEHGDALKAKHVMMFLKMNNVDALLNNSFGPNIKRIKLRFLPIISRKQRIDEALDEIMSNIDIVQKELDKGVEKKHLVMN